jgi:methyl-accepting chemotaxis protein
VRNLAQRSATASKETEEIIEKNMVLTGTSRASAEKVMKLAQQNAKEIGELGKLLSEISAASDEQAGGIKQINIAVSQMEKVTQENAAVAEETSASANSMKDEGRNLEDLISGALGMISKNG